MLVQDSLRLNVSVSTLARTRTRQLRTVPPSLRPDQPSSISCLFMYLPTSPQISLGELEQLPLYLRLDMHGQVLLLLSCCGGIAISYAGIASLLKVPPS